MIEGMGLYGMWSAGDGDQGSCHYCERNAVTSERERRGGHRSCDARNSPVSCVRDLSLPPSELCTVVCELHMRSRVSRVDWTSARALRGKWGVMARSGGSPSHTLACVVC